jgi:hypothetical protein
MQLYKATKDAQYMVWSATANILQATAASHQLQGGEAASDDKLLALADALLRRQLTFAPAEAKEETLLLMLHVLELRRTPDIALQLLQACAFFSRAPITCWEVRSKSKTSGRPKESLSERTADTHP